MIEKISKSSMRNNYRTTHFPYNIDKNIKHNLRTFLILMVSNENEVESQNKI